MPISVKERRRTTPLGTAIWSQCSKMVIRCHTLSIAVPILKNIAFGLMTETSYSGFPSSGVRNFFRYFNTLWHRQRNHSGFVPGPRAARHGFSCGPRPPDLRCAPSGVAMEGGSGAGGARRPLSLGRPQQTVSSRKVCPSPSSEAEVPERSGGGCLGLPAESPCGEARPALGTGDAPPPPRFLSGPPPLKRGRYGAADVRGVSQGHPPEENPTPHRPWHISLFVGGSGTGRLRSGGLDPAFAHRAPGLFRRGSP